MKVKGLIKDITGANRVTQERRVAIQKATGEDLYDDPIRLTARKLHPGRMTIELMQLRNTTRDAKIFRFGAKNIPYFEAGQYLVLTTKIGNSIVSRPYSICSAPYEALGTHPIVEIVVKRGRGSTFVSDYLLTNAKMKDLFIAEIGLGNFTYNELRDSKNVVAIVGGSGISPILSMAKAVKHGDLNINSLTILYGSITPDDILLKEELEKCICDKVKVVYVLSGNNPTWTGEKGFIDAEIISKYAPRDASYFVCGPQIMYDFVKEELKKIRVPERRIRLELFGMSRNPLELPGFDQSMKDKVFKLTVVRGLSETVIDAIATEPLSSALERVGIKIHTNCRSGACGVCRVKVLEGTYYVSPHNDGRRKADIDFNYVHSCSTYPTSDMKIKINI